MNHHITRRTLLAGTAAGSAAVALGVVVAGAAHADDPAYPQLRLGSREGTYTPVRTVQYLLRRWVPSLAVDGSFGYGTQAAVRRFQSAEQLPVSGRLSTAAEWYRLLLRSEVRQGSRGNAVVALQISLNQRISPPAQRLVVDGSFGTKTTQAVKIFQLLVNDSTGYPNLKVDGVAGPATWHALLPATDI